MSNYDVVIVGSGLAGLTAGLFAARNGLSTLVLESNIPGGHLISIEKVEDFPGFPDGVAGYDLCPNLQRQAADQGADFSRGEVEKLRAADSMWDVVTSDGSHRAKAVILAMGSSVKELGVPGETRLRGRGVSHCASCDGPLYPEKTVGVVGGGDSALQEALTLTNYVERVVIFNAAEVFSAQQTYVRLALNHSKIEPRYRTVVEEIIGDDVVCGVRVRDLALEQTSQVDLTGLFVYVGMRPNTTIVEKILRLSESGHVLTDPWMRTELPGLYAAGDIRQDSAAQAITCAGDGATAAIAAYRYIQENFR
jgi:thioredoxin reductase (NADPH)